ncbi:hypothetical protein V8E54_003285 [Elaphomyces granulatus]
MPMPVASSASNSGAFVSASLPTQGIFQTRPEDQASRGRPRKYTKKALASPEVQPRPRGQSRKVIPEQETLGAAEKHPTTFEQAELEKTRKDLVDARVQFEDDRRLQKQRDSDLRAWCKPVTRELQLDTVQSFYKAIHDETTLECRLWVVKS